MSAAMVTASMHARQPPSSKTPATDMKFHRDEVTSITIRRVERGQLQVGDELVTGSAVLTADEVVHNWSPPAPDDWSADDVDRLVDLEPELVVVGTGWSQVLPPRELVFAMARRGIGIEFMDTPAAARTFNILVAEGRRTVALLQLD